MAPSQVTEDYYMFLEVEQTATPDSIVRSYRRLALKLHPDRNSRHDTTAAFQLLGQAYETLKNESKRREYDLIYPSLTRQRPSPQNTQRPHAPSASNPQSESVSEAARIVAIQKSKQERSVQWQAKRKVFDSSIFELQRGIRRLEQEIKNLDSISAAEKAVEAQKNSWGTWLISPLYKTLEESEAEKARKDRQKQERRFEKDMKERRLDSKKVDLKAEEYQLRKTKEEIDAADLRDDEKIRMIQTKRQARENRESEERAKVEKELLARIQKQQQEEREKKERDALEAMRKRYQERVRKQQKADEANTHRGQYTHFDVNKGSTYEARTSACRHGGWWPKVQGLSGLQSEGVSKMPGRDAAEDLA